MVRRPVVSTAPSIRVKKRLKVGGVKAPANACSRGRAAPGRRDMRGPPCVGDMGTAIYLYVTSKGVRFVDPNRSREGSERAKVELRARYNNFRTITTLDGVLHLTLSVRRCPNPSCPRFLRPYRPEAEP